MHAVALSVMRILLDMVSAIARSRANLAIESVPQAHKEKEVQDEQELKLCA